MYAAPAFRTTTDRIDRAALMARDPILFFEEVPLFESELDDNGVSALHVKARAGPPLLYSLIYATSQRTAVKQQVSTSS